MEESVALSIATDSHEIPNTEQVPEKPSVGNTRQRKRINDSSGFPLSKPHGGSKKSLTRSSKTSGSFNSQFPNSSEVSETIKSKVQEMKWALLSLVFNSLMLYLNYLLTIGVIIPIDTSIAVSFSCVILSLLHLLQSLLAEKALAEAASAYFGARLASKHGYSLAVCGFLQTKTFYEKLMFPGFLSLSSPCRVFLSRLSGLWVLLGFTLILGPISSSGTTASSSRKNSGTIDCILYRERGQQLDRKYPTATYESGTSEVIFGTALGIPRSEFPIDKTLSVISPQIVGAVNDGDTIIGDGFATDILTSCVCAPTTDSAGLTTAGVPSNQLTSLLNGIASLAGRVGMSNYADFNYTAGTLVITSVVIGTQLCGGDVPSNPHTPVCFTTFSNHRHASILVDYMTDGTPASIAQKSVHVLNFGASANMTWVIDAMLAMLEGQTGYLHFPPTIPSLVNPIFWWTTSNLLSVDPTLFSAGMETVFAILYRAGVQRTYQVRGTTCVHNIAIPGISTITVADYGIKVGYALCVIELIVSMIAVCAYIPWLKSESAIGPAVRLTRDSIYFMTVLHSTNLFDPSTLGTAQGFTIWQALDKVVRVGEAINGKDDDAVGHVTMDIPKFIAPLTNGKRYN